jgi:hypothetical protein
LSLASLRLPLHFLVISSSSPCQLIIISGRSKSLADSCSPDRPVSYLDCMPQSPRTEQQNQFQIPTFPQSPCRRQVIGRGKLGVRPSSPGTIRRGKGCCLALSRTTLRSPPISIPPPVPSRPSQNPAVSTVHHHGDQRSSRNSHAFAALLEYARNGRGGMSAWLSCIFFAS